MKVLVLCIDRDDDLGLKTKIEGPVIGRHECVRAALALGLADPEDADTNTMLAAISTYEELTKKGINAEVATITGDVNVGYQSDIELTRQLEETLEVTMATSHLQKGTNPGKISAQVLKTVVFCCFLYK